MGGRGDLFPQKMLKVQSPKIRFLVFWGLNWGQKNVFFSQENVVFIQVPINYQPHNQFLQPMNKK